MLNKIVKTYSEISFFIYYLFSALTWLYFTLPFSVPLIIFFSGVFIEFKIYGYRKFLDRYILFALFSLIFLCVWDFLIGNGINGIVMLMPVVFLLFIKEQRLKVIFERITLLYAFLMTASIVMYILSFRFPLPYIGVIKPINYPEYYNCIVYLQDINKLNLDFFRFNGPFVEPGHLSMASCFIVIANRLKFNRILFPIYLSIILSFSLAGYVILVIAVVLIKVRNIKALFIISFFVAIIGVSLNYVSEDNPLSTLILNRLALDEEKGIQGNNRFHGSTDLMFEKAINNGEIIIGLGEDRFKDYLGRGIINGAGYKIYLLEKGMIGFCMLLAFYISLALKSSNRKYAYIYLIIILLAFLQRAYMGSYAWIYPYLSCVLTISKKSIKYKGNESYQTL